MKIHIRHINKNGYDLALNDKESWLNVIFASLIPDHKVDLPSVGGHIHLDNFEGNVNLSGQIEFTHHPFCARCGAELTRREKIPLQANLIPFRAIDGEKPRGEEEEIELTGDDLDFAFYENEEVDIDPVINDEIALALPYNYYCKDAAQCESAHLAVVAQSDRIDPRWAALKNFKVPRSS
jgi:uncharacterized metal-binding protein YceD (DUF177 family)